MKILLSGCNGRLGVAVADEISRHPDLQLAAGVDKLDPRKLGAFPVFADPMEYMGTCDIVIDCSHPSMLGGLISYCERINTPLVLCPTGYSDADLAAIADASERIAIFRSYNMSLGVALLADLAAKAAALLGDTFDIEILERHHRRKVDAPSGTAYVLLDAIKQSLNYEPIPTYDRHLVREPRGKTEIGLHAIRGGTITGDHTVLFAGTDETIELKHSASSRAVFASGAVKAARFMLGKTGGLFGMKELVAEYTDR